MVQYSTENMVSIITPCYNSQSFVAEMIESVLSQDYRNWELLIVDDGSKDNTGNIVRKYESADNRIKYFYQENKGSSFARNVGIENATGRYLSFLDSDDIWLPSFLSGQIKLLQSSGTILVCSAYRRFIDKNLVLSYVVPPNLLTAKKMKTRNFIGCLTGVYDTEKYGKKYFDESLGSMRDDYAYWLNLVCLEGYAIGNPRVLAMYRVNKNSISAKKIRLVSVQYKFYHNYLGQGVLLSLIHVIVWGFAGLRTKVRDYLCYVCNC